MCKLINICNMHIVININILNTYTSNLDLLNGYNNSIVIVTMMILPLLKLSSD